MTKKCLVSFITYLIFSAICIAGMHLMLLADVNKYVGVGSGGGILVLALVLYIIFHQNKKLKGWVLLFLLASAIGCGLAISSLYVYLGSAPEIIYSFCIWSAYAILFLVYCLLTNIPFFKRHPYICLIVYGILVLAGGIVGIALSSEIIFALVLMLYLLFISFLATILTRSRNLTEHIGVLTIVSFIGLFVVVIIVLLVISQGDGADGVTFDPAAGGVYVDPKKNPYDYNGNQKKSKGKTFLDP